MNDDCKYVISDMNPVVHEIIGNYAERDYFANVSLPPEPSTNFTFIRGKLKITAQYFGQDEEYNGTSQYFFWDVADCNYYPQISCGIASSADIIIKYDGTDHKLYFFFGNNPGENAIWEEVSGQIRRYIDYAPPNTIPCQLTSIPKGLSVRGNNGEHPKISWEPNTEVGLGGYKLYRSLDGIAYELIATLDRHTTSYIDYEVIVGGSKTDPHVCYKLSAFGRIDVESPKTRQCQNVSSIPV